MEPRGLRGLPVGSGQAITAFMFATLLAAAALLPRAPDLPAAPTQPPAAAQDGRDLAHEGHTEAGLSELLGEGPVLRDEAALRGHCAAANPGGLPCIESALARLLVSDGPAAAYALLDLMSGRDADLLLQQHNVAHALGRVNYLSASGVRAAISTCPSGMGSGCMHGVLETFLGTQEHVDPASLRGLCQEPKDGSGGDFRVFNCLHGLGHGLTMYAGHDWHRALEMCDGLLGSWTQSACHGGVFMQNIVGDSEGLRGGAVEGHAHGAMAENATYPRFRPEDPRYPCSVLPDRYLSACYLMQTSMVFHFRPNDWDAGFAMCAGAPPAWQSICYESVGRDASGATLRDALRTLQTCGRGNGTLARSHCLVGAVKDYVNNAGALGPGIEFCGRNDVPFPASCWDAVGQMAAAIHPQRIDREAACAPVPEAWRARCLGEPARAATSSGPPTMVAG